MFDLVCVVVNDGPAINPSSDFSDNLVFQVPNFHTNKYVERVLLFVAILQYLEINFY